MSADEEGKFIPGNASEYEENIVKLEEETEQKVSHTISKIEVAVETWNAAGKKPENIRPTIVLLQRFYDELVVWEKKSLLSKKETNVGLRIARLKNFVDICAKYEKANW